VRKDGIVQIMDFGLAKLRGVSRLTKEGSTLGTVGYMSPEQAQGQDVDQRSDIFSLGVVLFEMLTGELPFRGAHEAAIMYEIVNVDSPPPSALKPEIDPELDRIVLECLQKEPDERYQSAKEIAKDLRRFKRDSGRKRVSRISSIRPSAGAVVPRTDTTSHVTMASMPITKKGKGVLPWVIAAISIIAAVALVYMKFGMPQRGPAVVRAYLFTPDGTELTTWGGGHLSLSPNGQYLAYVATDSLSGIESLWVRPLNSLVPSKLSNTVGASYPFWSPDSRYIGFFAFGKLRKISANGGPALTLCDAFEGRGGGWNADDVIIFAPNSAGSALMRVSAAGGEPEPLTTLDSSANDFTHRWPWFLPDGRHFLYFARTVSNAGGERDAICLGSLDGGVGERLFLAKSNVAYAAGHILFSRDGTLMAQPFDMGKLALAGDAFPIAEQIATSSSFSRAHFTASTNGVLAYSSGLMKSGSQIRLYDRKGDLIDSIGGWEANRKFVLSPDESRLAVTIGDEQSGSPDIWIYDLDSRIRSRLTFGGADRNISPAWSPDGTQIAYISRNGDSMAVKIVSADGVQGPRQIAACDYTLWADQWSSDGLYLIGGANSQSVWYIEVRRVADGEVVLTLGDSLHGAEWPALSPDGRWLAYTSDESGQQELYVTPFPALGAKWQVSTNFGTSPIWRGDGKELFYKGPSERIMAAAVDGKGNSFKVGEVTPLIDAPNRGQGGGYDVSSDGQRFLVKAWPEDRRRSVITLVTNWDQELKDK